VASIGGLAKLVVDLSDDEGRRIYVAGCYEPDVTSFAMAVLREGDVALDIGANLGAHTVLFAALVAAAGHVHAFEPNPIPAAKLRASVSCNGWEGRVTIHEVAVSHHRGEDSLAIGVDAGVTSSLLDLPWLHDSPRISVETTTLDAFSCAHLSKPPRLMKVDVEGAEEFVLAGGTTAFFPNTPPDYLAIEFWSYRAPGPLLRTIAELGYSPVAVRDGFIVAHSVSAPRQRTAQLHDTGFEYRNLFFAHANAGRSTSVR
jgi:FkbM family methyltransferase